MIMNKLKNIKLNIALMIIVLCVATILSSCKKSNPVTASPPITETTSEQPSTTAIIEESDYIKLDMLIQYQNGIQVLPVIYDVTSVNLKASDGYEIRLDLLLVEGIKYPTYFPRQNETLDSPLIPIPETDSLKYLLCNHHKIYLIDLSVPSIDMLLTEADEDTTYAKSLEHNQANGLYWGTKPILSDDGHYLLYLTNRRNNGKTNDIRLYDFNTKEDILLAKDSYYTDAYISDTTVFYTCKDMLMRIEISSKAKAAVSYSISSNGSFSYPYYIYTTTYYQKYEILNLLTLNVEKGSLGTENSALKILSTKTNRSNTAAFLLLDKQKITLSFVDIQHNKLIKTFVLSDSFRLVYTQWKDNNTLLVSGYEGDTNEKTYLLSY